MPYFAARVLLNENEQRDPTATEERLRVERWIAQAVRLAPWIRLQINAVHLGSSSTPWSTTGALWMRCTSTRTAWSSPTWNTTPTMTRTPSTRATFGHSRTRPRGLLRSLHLREAFVVRNGVDVREGVVRLDDAADEDHRLLVKALGSNSSLRHLEPREHAPVGGHGARLAARADRVALGADAVAAKAAVTPTALPTTLALKRSNWGSAERRRSPRPSPATRWCRCVSSSAVSRSRGCDTSPTRWRGAVRSSTCTSARTRRSIRSMASAPRWPMPSENGGSLQSLVCSEVRIVDLGALAQAVAQEGQALTHLSIRGAGLPLRLPVVAPGRWKWLTAFGASPTSRCVRT